MKHLKTYERNKVEKDGKYWLLTSRDKLYVLASLRKIGYLNEDQYKISNKDAWILSTSNTFEFEPINKMYVVHDINEQRWFFWNYSLVDSIKKTYKYMGRVKITAEEIKELETKIDANKYNL